MNWILTDWFFVRIFPSGKKDAQKTHEKGVYKLELETWDGFYFPNALFNMYYFILDLAEFYR